MGEPDKKGIDGIWMVAGVTHTLSNTQCYTDLELIRVGTLGSKG